MNEEIQILLEANGKGCLIVEKDSHLLWEREELLEAEQNGRYRERTHLLAADTQIEMSAPFPGCMQIPAATRSDLDFRLLGQTQHFVIFSPAEKPVPRLGARERK